MIMWLKSNKLFDIKVNVFSDLIKNKHTIKFVKNIYNINLHFKNILFDLHNQTKMSVERKYCSMYYNLINIEKNGVGKNQIKILNPHIYPSR